MLVRLVHSPSHYFSATWRMGRIYIREKSHEQRLAIRRLPILILTIINHCWPSLRFIKSTTKHVLTSTMTPLGWQALANKQSAGAAVGLLCAAFRFLPFELYCNHFQAMAISARHGVPVVRFLLWLVAQGLLRSDLYGCWPQKWSWCPLVRWCTMFSFQNWCCFMNMK